MPLRYGVHAALVRRLGYGVHAALVRRLGYGVHTALVRRIPGMHTFPPMGMFRIPGSIPGMCVVVMHANC